MLKLLSNKKLQRYIASFLFIINLFILLPNQSYADNVEPVQKTKELKKAGSTTERNNLESSTRIDKDELLNHIFKIENVKFIEDMPEDIFDIVVDKAEEKLFNILQNIQNDNELEEEIMKELKKTVEDYKEEERRRSEFLKEKRRKETSLFSRNMLRDFISPSPRVNSEITLVDSFDGDKELGTIQATGGFVAVSDINKVVKDYSVDFSKHDIDTFIDVRNTGGKLYLIPDYVEFDVEYVVPFQLDFDNMLAIPEKKSYHKKALVKHNMKSSTDVFKGEGFYKYIGAPSSMSKSDLDLDRILNEVNWKTLELEDNFVATTKGTLENANFTINDLKDKNKRKVKIEIQNKNILRSNISIDLVDRSTGMVVSNIHIDQPVLRLDSEGNLEGEEIILSFYLDIGYEDIIHIATTQDVIERVVRIYDPEVGVDETVGRRFYLNKNVIDFDEFKVKGKENKGIILGDKELKLEVNIIEENKDLLYPKIVFYDVETGEILDYFNTEPSSNTTGTNTTFRIKSGEETHLVKDWKVVNSGDEKFFTGNPEFTINNSSFSVRDVVYSRNSSMVTPIRSRVKKVPLQLKNPSNAKTYRVKTYSNDVSHRDLAFRPVGAENQRAKDKVNAYFDYEIRRPARETEHKILSINIFDEDFIGNNKGIDVAINEHFDLKSTKTFGSVARTLEDVRYSDAIELNKGEKHATLKPGNKKEIPIYATGKKFSDVFNRFYLSNLNTVNGIKGRAAVYKRVKNVENSDARLYTPGIELKIDPDNLLGEEIYAQEVLFAHDKKKDREGYKDNKISGQFFHVSNMGTSANGLNNLYTPSYYIYTRDGKYTDFTIEMYNNKTGKLMERKEINNVSHDVINPELKSTVMGHKLGYKFSHHDYPNKDLSDISSSGDNAVIKTYYEPNRLMIKLEHYDPIAEKVMEEEYFLANVGDVYTPKEIDYDKVRLERKEDIVIPASDELEERVVVRFNYTPKEETFEIHYKDLDDNNKLVKQSTFKERYNNPVGDIEIVAPKGYDVKNVIKPTKLLNKDDKVIVELNRTLKPYIITAKDSETGEVLYEDKIDHKMISRFEYYPRGVEGYNKKSADPIIVEEGSETSYESSSNYTLYYTKKRYNVKVDYLTEDGKKIKTSDVYEVKHGDSFDIKAKELPLVSNPSPEELKISEVKENAELEFIYKADDVNITVNYIDQDGKLVKTESFKEKAYNSFNKDVSNVANLEKYELADKNKNSINVERLDKPSYSFDVDVLLKSFDLVIEGVDGSKYRVYDEDNDEEIILEIKENGKVVKNLPISNYKIKQIYAPDDYRINNKVEDVTVEDINSSYGVITLEFEQYKATTVPDTGTLGKLPFYALGILLGAMSVVLKKKKLVK